jgi:hypothetical protein
MILAQRCKGRKKITPDFVSPILFFLAPLRLCAKIIAGKHRLTLVLSFRRKPESSVFNELDTGLRRCDELDRRFRSFIEIT